MSLNDLASALGTNGNKKFLVDMILRLLTPLSSQWDTLSPPATGEKFIPGEKKTLAKKKRFIRRRGRQAFKRVLYLECTDFENESFMTVTIVALMT